MPELAQASWPLLQNLITNNINLSAEGLHSVANSHWPLLLSLNLSFNNLTGKLSALSEVQWPLLQSLFL
jgi:hypothetical protein